MTGSFRNVTVPLGYHKILDIPAGATFINVTEKRASPNYLGEACHTLTDSSDGSLAAAAGRLVDLVFRSEDYVRPKSVFVLT